MLKSIRAVPSRKPFSHSATVLCMYIPVLAQLTGSFVLSEVRAATGGRLRIALSGSTAFSQDCLFNVKIQSSFSNILKPIPPRSGDRRG